MKIDRSNYEVWLTDWLDGNLNEIQIQQLRHFLMENPDLKNEFDDLQLISLNPSALTFPHKEDIIKSTADLTESQLDYLSVAFLEKEMSPEQEEELLEAIGKDQKKRRAFELMQKIKLTPVQVPYSGKKLLLKKTPAQYVIRLSLIGLSAAAVITFIILNFFSAPQALPSGTEKTSRLITPDTAIKRQKTFKIIEKPVASELKKTTKRQNRTLLAKSETPQVLKTIEKVNPPDSMLRTPSDPDALIGKIAVVFNTIVAEDPSRNSLIAFNPTDMPSMDPDDGQSKLSKFIAKTFREKFLKEKTPKDTPLKAYEIAQAGVSGLNLLFGWQMALNEKNDEKGELKSVYFSSKIIKFNAPIKKTESAR